MPFAQPSADLAARAGADVFRINAPLSSPGDIYESTQSAFGFALGPQSEVSRVEVAYFDDQASDNMAQFTLTPQRAWTGRVDTRLDATYAPSSRPARILIWCGEIWNTGYRPTGFDSERDTIEFFAPQLDVLQYLLPGPMPKPYRADKQMLFQRLPFPADGLLNLVLPFYGRRYGSLMFENLTGDALTGQVLGVNFGIGDADIEKVIDTINIAAGADDTTIVRTNSVGMFDALLLQVGFIGAGATTGPIAARILFSDTEV